MGYGTPETGHFNWAPHDRQALLLQRNRLWPPRPPAQAESRVLFADEAAYEPELRQLIAHHVRAELFLAPMLVSGAASLYPQLRIWFDAQGEAVCRKSFGCWPAALDHAPGPLEDIPPAELTLFAYLAPLSRKTSFSADNMPKHIRAIFPYDRMMDALAYLCGAGLLEETGFEVYAMGGSDRAVTGRILMQEAVRLSLFCLEAERWTYSVAEDIRTSRLRGGRALFSCRTKDREELPCPICRKLPNRKVSLPPERIPLSPFHYRCGNGRPRPGQLSDDLA